MAFVLGWQSKLVLLKATPHKPTRFHLMNLYTKSLGVTLPQPLEYYLGDPSNDQGARAEAFVEETFNQLKRNRTIANHFGIASNILVILAQYGSGRSGEDVKAEFELLARGLDVPASLKSVPSSHLYEWAADIERYFELLLIDDPREDTSATEPNSTPSISFGR